MKINPKILELALRYGITQQAAKLFCFAISYDCFDALLYSNTIDEESLETLRIHFCTQDFDSGKLSLKFDLFVIDDEEDDFAKLLSILKAQKFTVNGHPQNRKPYGVLSTDNETKEAFHKMKLDLGKKYNLEKVAKCIIHYYLATEMPTKLLKYLNNQISIDYDVIGGKEDTVSRML